MTGRRSRQRALQILGELDAILPGEIVVRILPCDKAKAAVKRSHPSYTAPTSSGATPVRTSGSLAGSPQNKMSASCPGSTPPASYANWSPTSSVWRSVGSSVKRAGGRETNFRCAEKSGSELAFK